MLQRILFAALALALVTSGAHGQAAGGDLSGTYPNPTVVGSHLSSPLPVAQGGTGASTASGARASLGAAASGSNSDITALTGLTNPLWPTLANMAALTGSNWSAYAYSAGHQNGLNIMGYATTNDGGQGSFAAVSSCTVDGGVCVQDSAGNYFQRQIAGDIKPEFWGAVGDNSTDNTTAFNNANTYMAAQATNHVNLTLRFGPGLFRGDYPAFTGYAIAGAVNGSGYTASHPSWQTTIIAHSCRAAVIDTTSGPKDTYTGTVIYNINVYGIGPTCPQEYGIRLSSGQLRPTVYNVSITNTGGEGLYTDPNEQAGEYGIGGKILVVGANLDQAAMTGPQGGCDFAGYDDDVGDLECGSGNNGSSFSTNYNLSFTATGSSIAVNTLTIPAGAVTVGTVANGMTLLDTTGTMAKGRMLSACSGSNAAGWTCTVSGASQTVGAETMSGIGTAASIATYGIILNPTSDVSMIGPVMAEDSDAGALILGNASNSVSGLRVNFVAGFGIVNYSSAIFVAPRVFGWGVASPSDFDGIVNLAGTAGYAAFRGPTLYSTGSGNRYGINDLSTSGGFPGPQARYEDPVFRGTFVGNKNFNDAFIGPVVSNLSSGQLILTANATTPSVCDWLNWRTANTSPTAYANLLCGVSGDLRTVHVNDANSSFVNSSVLKMCGGVNHTGTMGETLTFLNYNGVWYQTNCGWPNAVTVQGGTLSPTAPASTASYAMQGLAATCTTGTCTFTPRHSGKVQLTISGTIVAFAGATAGDGIQYKLYYGTGSAPANAAAVTGTQCSAYQQAYVLQAMPGMVANVMQPFSVTCTASLTVGTTYWFDLAAESLGTMSHIGLSNTMQDAIEN